MFTPEQEAALKKLLEERDSKLVDSFSKKLDDILDVTQHRSKKETETNLSALQKQLGEVLNKVGNLESSVPKTVQSAVDSMLESLAEEALEEEKAASGTSNFSPSNDVESLIAARLEETRKEMAKEAAEERKKFEKRLKMAEEAAEAEKTERQRVAEQNRLQKMQEDVLSKLSGKVLSGKERRALKAMLDEGVLVPDEESSAYKVKQKDKYGEEVLVDPGEVLPTILAESFSEFLPPRSGTGTGAVASNATPSTYNSSPQFVHEGIKPQEFLEIAADETKFNEAVKELEQLIKS